MAPGLPGATAIQFVQENPKRKGTKSHDRYETYMVATTVEEALRLGAVQGDITNDRKAGFLTVLDGDGASVQLAASVEKKAADQKPKRKRSSQDVKDAATPLHGRGAAADAALASPAKRQMVVSARPVVPEAAGAAGSNAMMETEASAEAANAMLAAEPTAAEEAAKPAEKKVACLDQKVNVERAEPVDVAGALPAAPSEDAPMEEAANPAQEKVACLDQNANVEHADPVDVAGALPAAPSEEPFRVVPEHAPEAPPQQDGGASSSVPSVAPVAEKASASSESVAPRPLRPASEEVDLSFATFEGKPLKFIKRTMGEARKLLCAKGLEEARNLKYEFRVVDRLSLSKWHVRLFDLNPEGKLAKQLQERSLEASVDLEISLPDGYPLEPPFVRVVYPFLAGGFIFEHGGICFELLTKKGWAPSITLSAVAVAVQGIMDQGDVRVKPGGNADSRTVPQFTEDGARRDAKYIASAHKDGERNTYGGGKMKS